MTEYWKIFDQAHAALSVADNEGSRCPNYWELFEYSHLRTDCMRAIVVEDKWVENWGLSTARRVFLQYPLGIKGRKKETTNKTEVWKMSEYDQQNELMKMISKLEIFIRVVFYLRINSTECAHIAPRDDEIIYYRVKNFMLFTVSHWIEQSSRNENHHQHYDQILKNTLIKCTQHSPLLTMKGRDVQTSGSYLSIPMCILIVCEPLLMKISESKSEDSQQQGEFFFNIRKELKEELKGHIRPKTELCRNTTEKDIETRKTQRSQMLLKNKFDKKFILHFFMLI